MNKETLGNTNIEIGASVNLLDTDQQLINQYRSSFDALSDENRRRSFRNVISYSGNCGFANGGSCQYLINTDTGNTYRVTVRVQWYRGIDSGSDDRVFTINAGSKLYLGCTKGNDLPTTRYDRQVVGEEIL
ncbi:MAG: hypothetical protein AAGA77_13355 [Bacteroidota bacterium]